MAKRILQEQGGGNTSSVRTAVSVEGDFRAGQGLQMEDLVIAEVPCRVTLPEHPYKAQIIQVVADKFHDDGRVHVHGGKNPINGGDLHIKSSSTVTLTFTGGEDGEWVPSTERGPRGHRGEDGPKGDTGPKGNTGATGPCCTGPTGTAGSLVKTSFFPLEEDLTVTGAVFVPIITASLLSFTPGNFVEILATFSCSSIDPQLPSITNPTVADFALRIDGVIPQGVGGSTAAEVTIVALLSSECGSIVYRIQAVGAGLHTIELVARMPRPNQSVEIVVSSHERNHASLFLQETSA